MIITSNINVHMYWTVHFYNITFGVITCTSYQVMDFQLGVDSMYSSV